MKNGHTLTAISKLTVMSLLLGFSCAGSAQAVTLFDEDFEGYTTFTGFLDPVNSGIPKLTEGASETWYAARFQGASTGLNTLNGDLAIQKFGGGTNNSHVGRVSDDAGLVFKIDTTGYSSATLSFDWRTFKAETGDKIVVGYHNGPISEFGSCNGNGSSGCFAELGSGSNSWTSGWTQLLQSGPSDSWASQSYALAPGQSEVWVAFWMDGTGSDYAKFDNVLVTAAPIPEADSWAMLLAGLGLVGFAVRNRQKN